LRRTLLWAIPALAILGTIGTLGLLEPTETRYAEIAREMAAGGDYMTPRLNGIAHFHKPPLAYWAAAGGMALLGRNEWGARLGTALAAGFALWCLARLALGIDRRRDGGPERAPPLRSMAPLLFGSMGLSFALSHELASDVFLAATVVWFHASILDGGKRRGYLPFVALAVGFMAKGPVVFVHTVVPLLVAALWTRNAGAARRLASGRGWALFAAIAFPWYLIESARTPGLLPYFLGNQIWERYATTIHQRGGPPTYFIVVVLAGALPWTAAALAGLWRDARAASREREFESALLVAWAVLPVVFFSTSGSKLPAYVLPEFAALALLAARALDERDRVALWGGALSLLALAVLIPALGPRLLARALGATHAATLPIPIGASVAAGALAAAAVACLARRPSWGAVLGIAAWCSLWIGAKPLEGPLGSPKPIVGLLRDARDPEEPVVLYERFNAGVPFYLGEKVRLLEVPRELGFEDAASRTRVLVRPEDLPRLAAERGRVWILAPTGRVEPLAASVSLEATVMARWNRCELAALSPPPARPRE
jgi:4-amino-4-deoxy-L-arabinose transferase-like glycosyltransferase